MATAVWQSIPAEAREQFHAAVLAGRHFLRVETPETLAAAVAQLPRRALTVIS